MDSLEISAPSRKEILVQENADEIAQKIRKLLEGKSFRKKEVLIFGNGTTREDLKEHQQLVGVTEKRVFIAKTRGNGTEFDNTEVCVNDTSGIWFFETKRQASIELRPDGFDVEQISSFETGDKLRISVDLEN